MAKIGLSKPYFAKYSNTASTVTYTDGALLGKAVELSIELEDAEDNILYADNGPAETANTFSGGSFTLTTDDLMPDVMLTILGLQQQTITSEEITTETPSWYVWDDRQATPYLGFGAIVKIQKDGATKWQAIVLPKIKFSNPSDTFTTQGESIEWGTPEISGTIQRSDAVNNPWKMVSSPLDSEADAEAAIKQFLQITDDDA
nr:MAG TPA: tail tube protein [Caudoviricetes sp.]